MSSRQRIICDARCESAPNTRRRQGAGSAVAPTALTIYASLQSAFPRARLISLLERDHAVAERLAPPFVSARREDPHVLDGLLGHLADDTDLGLPQNWGSPSLGGRRSRIEMRQHVGGDTKGHQRGEMGAQPIQLRRRSTMRWPSDTAREVTAADTTEPRQLYRHLAERCREQIASPAVDVTPTSTRRTLRPSSRKIALLRGDNCLLHARQKLLRLGQRQPQIGYVAGPIRPADLHGSGANRILLRVLQRNSVIESAACNSPIPQRRSICTRTRGLSYRARLCHRF